MNDRLARILAASALACALVAVVLAGYAVSIGETHVREVRRLTDGLRAIAPETTQALPLRPPPPELDPDDR